MTTTETPQQHSAGQLVLIIAAGILAALLVAWGAYSLVHADDDLQCTRDNLRAATDGQPTEVCD